MSSAGSISHLEIHRNRRKTRCREACSPSPRSVPGIGAAAVVVVVATTAVGVAGTATVGVGATAAAATPHAPGATADPRPTDARDAPRFAGARPVRVRADHPRRRVEPGEPADVLVPAAGGIDSTLNGRRDERVRCGTPLELTRRHGTVVGGSLDVRAPRVMMRRGRVYSRSTRESVPNSRRPPCDCSKVAGRPRGR